MYIQDAQMFSSKINMKNTCVMMHFAKFGCQLTFTNWFSKDENVKFRTFTTMTITITLILYIKEDHLSLCLSDRAIKTFSCRHNIIRCMHIILMHGV